MRFDKTEFQIGLEKTRQYLFSHHEPSEWYRCYALVLFGQRIRICARCLGIYPGIIIGLATYFTGITPYVQNVLLIILPLPALIDWILTTFTGYRGYNVVRTATGALLGYGYGLGIGLLFGAGEIWILALGAVYVVAAGSLILINQQNTQYF